MTREKRMELMVRFVHRVNEDVSDLPKNEYRFTIKAEAKRGYEVVFTFTDNRTLCSESIKVKWLPLKTNKGTYIYPSEVLDGFNRFVIERRAY